MTPIRIGIAGHMGSGKSTFAQYLSKKGGTVFDADLIAKEIMNTNAEIKNQLAEKFGANILSGDNIQFNLLSKICFNSKANLSTLNGIVHKPVIKHLHSLMFSNRQKISILDAALISFWHIEKWFDILIWIHASRKIRLERLSRKIEIPYEKLIKRAELQESFFNEPVAEKWIIISNEGSIEDFRNAMHKNYQILKSCFKTKTQDYQ